MVPLLWSLILSCLILILVLFWYNSFKSLSIAKSLKHPRMGMNQHVASKIRCQSPLESVDSVCLCGTGSRCKPLKSGELSGVLIHSHVLLFQLFKLISQCFLLGL